MHTVLPSDEIYGAAREIIGSVTGQPDFVATLLEVVRRPTKDSFWARLAYFSGIAVGNSAEIQTRVAATIWLIHQASALLDNLQDGDLKTTDFEPGQAVNVAIAICLAPLSRLRHSFPDRATIDRVAFMQAEIAGTVIQMCSGQFTEAAQNRNGHLNTTLEAYEATVWNKTASFSALCCTLPAIAAGLNEIQTGALADFGRFVGMLYQIGNDYAGLQKRNRKTDIGHTWTWPTLYAKQVASPRDHEHLLKAWETQDSATVYQTLLENGALEFLVILAGTYKNRALEAIRQLDRRFDTEILIDLLNAVFPAIAEI